MKQLSALLLTLVAIAPYAPLRCIETVQTDGADNLPAKSTSKIKFNKAVFIPGESPALYSSCTGDLSANADDQPFQFAKTALVDGKAVMTGLAPNNPSVNGAPEKDFYKNAQGPLKTTTGKELPIVAFGPAGLPVYVPSVGGANKVHQMTADDGSVAIKFDGTETVKDKAGTAAKEVVALAASQKYVFAACSVNGQDWNDKLAGDAGVPDNRGVAILEADGTTKIKQDASAFALSFLAQKYENAGAFNADVVTAAGRNACIAFSNEAAEMKNANAFTQDASLFWHEGFNRLYIGLDVQGSQDDGSISGGTNAKGAIMGLTTLKVTDASTADVEGMITFAGADAAATPEIKTILADDSNKHIFAVLADAADNAQVMRVRNSNINSMKTSTDKDYLLVNSYVKNGSGGELKGLAALPLKTSDGRLARIANKDTGVADFAATPTFADEMPQADQPAVWVAPNLSPQALDKVSDLFVDGDTVYIACNDDVNNHLYARGLFRSTALFNADGAICGWTPATRVGGDLGAVVGGGYDANTGRFYALTSETNGYTGVDATPGNTVKIATGELGLADGATELGKVLADNLTAENGGIQRLVAFEDGTAGFKNASKDTQTAQLALMAGVGSDRVLLVEAGKANGGDYGVKPTADFSTFVVPLDKPALANIAPLSCVELSRSDITKETHYLFAGGFGGVVAFSDAGTGFKAAEKIADVKVTDAVQLKPSYNADFTDVRKLVALDEVVYVMTSNKVYGFRVSASGAGKAVEADRFNATANPLDEKEVVFTNLPDGAYFNDMLVVKTAADEHCFILATSKGLFFGNTSAGLTDGGNEFHTGTSAALTLTIALTQKEADLGLPALQLHYLTYSPDYSLSEKGNLFVLFGNPAGNQPVEGVVKRYYFDASVPTADLVAGAVTEGVNTFTLSDIRGGFSIDGQALFQVRSRDVENGAAAGLARRMAASKEAVDLALAEFYTDNELNMIATPVIDPASGNVIVPHQYGIFVNNQ